MISGQESAKSFSHFLKKQPNVADLTRVKARIYYYHNDYYPNGYIAVSLTFKDKEGREYGPAYMSLDDITGINDVEELVNRDRARYQAEPIEIDLPEIPVFFDLDEIVKRYYQEKERYFPNYLHSGLRNNSANYSLQLLHELWYCFPSLLEKKGIFPYEVLKAVLKVTGEQQVIGYIQKKFEFLVSHGTGSAEQQREFNSRLQRIIASDEPLQQRKQKLVALLNEVKLQLPPYDTGSTAAYVIKNILFAIGTLGIGYGIACIVHKQWYGNYTFFYPKLAREVDDLQEVIENATGVLPTCACHDSMFRCPITGEIMLDPVICADGVTYDRPTIQAWFDKGYNTSPMSGVELANINLIPNRALKSVIDASLERMPAEERAMLEERRASKFNAFLERRHEQGGISLWSLLGL